MIKDKSKDDLKKFSYNTQLELRFTKLYNHIDINDMPKNVRKGKEGQCT
jgi:hypothetical protein